MTTLDDLIRELNFQVIDGGSAYGDVDGCVVKFVVLGGESLSLLFGFLVGTEGPAKEVTLPPECLPAAHKTDLSLDDGIVWLTLFNLGDVSGAELTESIKQIVAELKNAGFIFPTQCSRCGADDTPVSLQGGQPVRVCLQCLEADQQKFAEKNRPKLSSLALLPLVIPLGAVAWTVVWLLIDLYVGWLVAGNPAGGLAVNQLTMIPMLAFAGVLFFTGVGLGRMIPSASMSRDFSITLSVFISLATVIVGELCYIFVLIFKQFGVIDFIGPFQLLIPVIRGYEGFWIFLKILMAGSLLGGCVAQARTRIY